MLDEPTEGIQPSIIKDIAKALNQLKAERKFALLVSEQVLSFTMEIADRFLIIEKGRVRLRGHARQGGQREDPCLPDDLDGRWQRRRIQRPGREWGCSCAQGRALFVDT